MMKKAFLSLAFVAAALMGMAADGKLHVKGNLKNVGDTLLVVINPRGNDAQTVLVKDGAFECDVTLEKVQTVYIVAPEVMRGQRGAQMQVLGVPGEEVVLTGDANDRYDITGSKFYKEYHEADLMLEAAQKDEQEFTNKCMEMLSNGVSRDSVMKVYNAGIAPLKEKTQKAITDFIKAHPSYEASAAMIPRLAADKMRDGVALLDASVRDGRMKAYYQDVIDRYEAQKKAEEESAKKQAAGVQAPDFTLNDINGKPLALSSLRGKYVVLDFWGSWCGWCIKGFPEMKEYYNKYKGKFEILGIDCNDTEEKWKEAVKKHELPWLHVYNPRSSEVLKDYGVQGFPTKIILGPDGKIVKTIVGESPEFYKLLDEKFGK